MQKDDLDPASLSAKFLKNPEGLARIRLGRGVVGNTTYGFLTLVVSVVAVVGFLRSTPVFASLVSGGLVLTFFIYMFSTHRFASNHPEQAMLGDAEYLKLQQGQMAAKEVGEIASGRIIEVSELGKSE